MVVMVNGKKRGIVEVSSNVNQEKLIEMIDNEKKFPYLKQINLKKLSFVKNKIINFVE